MELRTLVSFLHLCNKVINQDEEVDINSEQMLDLFQLALKSNMAAILYPVVSCYAVSNDSKPIISKWKITAIQIIVQQMRAFNELKEVIRLFEENEIVYCVFKGAVLADLYPEYNARYSCDSDIYVDTEYAERAIGLLKDRGYLYIEKSSKKMVPVYTLPDILTIELHYCLWEDNKGFRIEEMKKMNLCDRNSFIRVEACDMTFFALGHTEHFIFQIYHIVKHFSLDGVGVRNLIDISLFYNKHCHEIDLIRFWDAMKKLQFSDFCVMTFSICIEYFHMDSSVLLQKKTVMINQAYLSDIINVGMAGKGVESWKNIKKLTPYFEGSESVSRNRAARIVSYVFPSPRKLGPQYEYARKIVLLLPVAWIHRFVYNVYIRLSKKERLSALDSMKMVNERLNLMDELGLLNKKEK